MEFFLVNSLAIESIFLLPYYARLNLENDLVVTAQVQQRKSRLKVFFQRWIAAVVHSIRNVYKPFAIYRMKSAALKNVILLSR